MLGHQVLIDLLIKLLTNMVRSRFIFSSKLINLSISWIKSKWILVVTHNFLKIISKNNILHGGYCPGGILLGAFC